MSFLSKENSDLLYDVIKESINIDYISFNQRFLEFGQINGNKFPLIEMNKQFIRSFLVTPSKQQMSTNMPSRPQGSRSKNVSFDEELELHKQHFQQFAAPPPPTPPVFKDYEDESFLHVNKNRTGTGPGNEHGNSNLDLLMQKALSERKYDPIPPPSNSVRKIQIGSVIEDESYSNDVIDVDKFNHSVENNKTESNLPSVTTFFSKLQQTKNDSIITVNIEQENIMSTNYDKIYKLIGDLTQTVKKLSDEMESLKNTVEELSQRSSSEII